MGSSNESTNTTTEAMERRRLQNRLAQRNYRNNIKQRLRQLEWMDTMLYTEMGVPAAAHVSSLVEDQASSTAQEQLPATWETQAPAASPPSTASFAGQWPQPTEFSQQTIHQTSRIYVPGAQTHSQNQIPSWFDTLPDTISQQSQERWMERSASAKGCEFAVPVEYAAEPTKANAGDQFPDINSVYSKPSDEMPETYPTYIHSQSAIFRAATRGHTRIVKLLLDKGAKLDTRDIYGQTLLHIACIKGHRELAAFLIQAGIELDLKDNYGCTPLQLAAERGVEETVELLLNAGAIIDIETTSL